MTSSPVPTAEDLDRVDRELARRDFWEFFRYLDPEAIPSRWQEHAAGELRKFFHAWRAGKCPRLLLSAPPQHGKTRLVVTFLAWVLGCVPDAAVVYASFSKTLGERANQWLQRTLASARYREVFPHVRLPEGDIRVPGAKRRNLSLVELEGSDGQFRNTTVRGRINGEGFWLGVIDDPLKGHEEAESPLVRNRTWDWLVDDFTSRLKDDGAILGIGTRWHLDDPLGRLAAADLRTEALAYPALSEGAGDPLGRPEGEPLFPELKSLEFLLGQKSISTPASWSALYQQRPVPREGAVVKAEYLARRYRERGANPRRLSLSLDTAIKAEQRHDPTAALLFAEFEDHAELWDCRVGRFEFPELVRWTRDLAAGIPGLAALLVEDKGSGQQLLQQLRHEGGLPLVPVVPEGDKLTRMDTETPWLAAGNLRLPDDAPWVADFVAEVTTFPAAPHDDRVDALSQWLRWRREGETRLTDLSDACLAAAWGGGPTKESNRLRW